MFFKSLKLNAEDRVERLTPLLKLGRGWDLVADADKPTLRTLCRTSIRDLPKRSSPYHLRRQLCALGFDTEDDVKQLQKDLAADTAWLSAIKECPELPKTLHRDIEAIIDLEEVDPWVRQNAQEVLLMFADK